MRGNSLHKAARLATLVLMLEHRGRGRPRKREWNTAKLADLFGVSRRSIQRDIKLADTVRQMLKKVVDGHR
jgi:predicted DNA-binding transcriptional regulator YafY